MKRLWFFVLWGLLACCSAGNKPAAPSAAQVARSPLAALPPLPSFLPKIDRQPAAVSFGRGTLPKVPTYDPASDEMWQMDLRSFDLTGLDLRGSIEDLMFASFDSKTKWPPADRMPKDYDWSRILELGTNPGLGVRGLHSQGVDGRGVGIAIIDQPLIVSHVEYSQQLRLYEEINVTPGTPSQMHGPAVASIAVGRSVGVAPEADLYYIGSWTGDWGTGATRQFTYNFVYYAQAVRRVLELNALLPADRKIRVITMQIGWNPQQKGYDDITAAVNEAKAAGLLVVSSSLESTFGFRYHGLGRRPLEDPARAESYEPGMFWSTSYYSRGGSAEAFFGNRLMIPMDSRTTAGPGGPEDYAFYREGGWSWCAPYIAGLYALAAQTKPSVTPDEFWTAAMGTARDIDLSHDGKTIRFGRIVDPPALIAGLQKDAQ